MPSKVDLRDGPCVADVLQWVCVENDEVRELSGGKRTHIAQAKSFRGSAGPGDDRLHRRHHIIVEQPVHHPHL